MIDYFSAPKLVHLDDIFNFEKTLQIIDCLEKLSLQCFWNIQGYFGCDHYGINILFSNVASLNSSHFNNL